jgi:hypothetical protein
MAAITDEALKGEWFYLVEEQPLDRTSKSFYVLDQGEVRTGAEGDVVGTYSVEDGIAVITLHREIPFTTTITLNSADATFDETTSTLCADATHTLPDGSDPLYLYGSFVRRSADFPSVGDVWHRVR